MPEELKPETRKRWIFKSKYDFTLVLRPSTRRIVKDQYGIETAIPVKPIKVVFVKNTLEVNDQLALYHDVTPEFLVELLTHQPRYAGRNFTRGGDYSLIESPEAPADDKGKDIAKAMDKLAEEREPKVVQGPRRASK